MAVIEELGITFFFLVVGIIAAIRLKFPPVIGVLLIGAAIGPHGFALVRQSETIDAFADIGATLLLFVIGIEFSLSKIIKFGVRALLMTIAKLAITFILVYEIGILFGLSALEALIIGALFSITSTTIFSKLVKEESGIQTENTNLLLAVLIMEDIIAVLILAFVSSLSSSTAIEESALVLSIVKSLGVLFVAYAILEKIVKKFFDYIARVESDETLIFAAFTIAALFAFVATIIGVQPSIGAFLAGSIISTVKQFKKIEKIVVPFGLFFSSFFFFSIGMLVGPDTIAANWLIILLFVVVSMAAKFASISLSVYVLEKNGKNAIVAGLTMLSVGEFSLLIAKESSGFVSFDIMGVTASAVFLTALISGILIVTKANVQDTVVRNLSPQMRYEGKRTASYIGGIIKDLEPGGRLFTVYTNELRNIVVYTIIFLIVNGMLILFAMALENFGILDFSGGFLFFAKIAVHGLIGIVFLVALFKSIDAILSKTTATLQAQNRKTIDLDKKLFYDAVILAATLLTFFVTPLLISLMQLPHFVSHISLVPLAFAFIIVWGMVKTIHAILYKENKKRPTFLEKNGHKKKKLN